MRCSFALAPSRAVAALALCCALAGAAGAQTTSPPASAGEDASMLQPGDMLRITVWRQPELSGEFAVTSLGRIAHPLYRDVQVTGQPMSAVEAQLDTFLRRFVENPQFVVEPLLRVSVSGQVDRPNLYSVPPGTTIAQAVAQAGGITAQGRHDRVRLVRDQSERFIDLTQPRDGSIRVRSGDEIAVVQRSQWFRNVFLPTATIVGAVSSLVLAIRRD